MPAINFRMYADIAESYPFEEERDGPAARSLVLREPVGVAVLIPPFNGPLTLGTQKAAPALAAGCTVILKAPVQNAPRLLRLRRGRRGGRPAAGRGQRARRRRRGERAPGHRRAAWTR